MENASKALIIAGAILLSILIISLGIMVYQNAKETVGNTSLSKQEKEAFNSDWEKYVGTKKTASEVRTMVSAIISSNAEEKINGSLRYVKLSKGDTSTEYALGATVTSGTYYSGTTDISTGCPATLPTLSESITYTITAGYDNSTGLVNGMTITKTT